MSDELLTPTEWEKILNVKICDPDGWRTKDAPSWDTPITRQDFEARLAASTVWVQPRLDGTL